MRRLAIIALCIAATVASGDWRRGLDLNGSTEYAAVPDSADLDLNGAFTISFWMYSRDLTSNALRLVHKNGAYQIASAVAVAGGANSIRLFNYTDGSYGFSTQSYTENEWQLVTIVADGSTVTFWRNTTDVSSDTSVNASWPNSAVDLFIGMDEDGSSAPYDGQIAGLLIWNRALSTAEVSGLYNLTVAVTNEGASVEVPLAYDHGTNTLMLDLDMPETYDSGDAVTNGTSMPNNGSSANATIVGTPDATVAFQVPSPMRSSNSPNLPDTRASQLITNLEKGTAQTAVAYGTSISAYTDRWADQFDDWMAGEYGGLITFHNNASGSKNSTWGLANFQTEVLDYNPDTVFIEFAINDATAAVSYETAEANTTNMIGQCLAAGIETVLLIPNEPIDDPLSYRTNFVAYYQMYRDLGATNDLIVIDTYDQWHSLLTTNAAQFDTYVPDGIHPSVAGVTAMMMPEVRYDMTNAVPE